MKKVLMIGLISLIFSGVAYAEWQVTFEESYFNNGIDQAVIDALKEGADPDAIVERGLILEGLNPQNLVMALYCAGVKGQKIREAAENHEISDMVVTAGYKKSIVECGDAVADSQAYTPVSTGFSTRSAGNGGGSSASPDNFLQ